MLRQAFILNGNEIIYKRVYGNALSNSEMEDLSFKIISEVKRALGRTTGFFDFIKYRVSYDYDEGSKLTFIFITGLMDDFYRSIKTQLNNFKNFFLNRFSNEISNKNLKELNFVGINVFLDEIHRNLKPKIAVVGFAGVGKTTIKQLIKMDEIPLQHVPTITGEIATIKIGKLFFRLFDFAGQEQFKFLWKGFIKESDAVLIVTDSTEKNIEKSKFFLDLKTKEVPHARAAIIGNKQDLPNSLSISEIEKITGLKTYPMVANRKKNRDKMIRIIADILDMSTEDSPLLSELFESTDLSYETLFGLEGEPIKEASLIIPEGSASLEIPPVEEKSEINEIADKIGQLIPYKSDGESLIEINKRHNQGLKMPVENALITSELFSEFEKNKSFGYYDKLSILFTALNCVFLTKTNPKKFPKFSAFFKNYKMHIFNSKEINQIRKYYSKVLKQVRA